MGFECSGAQTGQEKSIFTRKKKKKVFLKTSPLGYKFRFSEAVEGDSLGSPLK